MAKKGEKKEKKIRGMRKEPVRENSDGQGRIQ